MFVDFKSQEALTQKQIVAQIDPSPERSPKAPLINYGAEHLIDFGVVLLAVTIENKHDLTANVS